MFQALNCKFLVLSILIAICFVQCAEGPAGKEVEEQIEDPLFVLLSPDFTNIHFQNVLEEGLNANILMYEYFYNGGGVAAGDLNGDGYEDLYFTSNMRENKVYLNQGNFQFKEVGKATGAMGRPGPWKTGVSMIDINGDQKLDIYLCYSGTLPDPKRVNQLFINEGNDANGIPQFSEQAAQFGLASSSYSNQSYFFDYDLDGDLDMLLLNHNPKSLPVLNEVATAELMKQDDPAKGLRLFAQENGKFEDITGKANILGTGLSYGLGLGITDINNDGWPDFYVSNDYAVPDYLYINNQDGTFSNQLSESLRYNSHFSMGNDVADINNDGLQDIITLDMLPEDNRRQKLLMAPDNYAKFDLNLRSGFHYQYMRNMLQVNNGNGTFSEIGQLAGISNTDWSWAALVADYDNDGWKDLYITNGYLRDYTNQDFINYMNRFVQQKGRLKREDVLEIINQMPSSNVMNYMYHNQEGKEFADKAKPWGLAMNSNSNGACYVDLDLDGDLDLVVNNINQNAFVFRNETRERKRNNYLQVKLEGDGMNSQGIGAKVSLISQGQRQVLEQYLSRGYLSSMPAVLHFGLGSQTAIDSLIIEWPSGKVQSLQGVQANQIIMLKENDANEQKERVNTSEKLFVEQVSAISFEAPSLKFNDFDRQPLLISSLSASGPTMTKGDINGDGLEDIFIGGAAGQSAILFVQQKGNDFLPTQQAAFEADKNMHDAAATFLDVNKDGNLDLYVASGGYHRFLPNDPLLQDRLYLNDGKGNFQRAAEAIPKIRNSNSCIAVSDLNADGYPDIFIGGRVVPGRYPETPASTLLLNDGKGNFQNAIAELAPELERMGMLTDAKWIDMDADGDEDLVVVGEWMPISVFELTEGKLENQSSKYFEKEYTGWWNTIESTDFNGDGKPDLLVGNVGLNTQVQASEEKPAELYFKDFDKNGAIDPIFCFYIGETSYPFVTRDELLRQLVGLRQRFTSYSSFADAKMEDIFLKEELRGVGLLEANHLENTLLLSQPNRHYQLGTLPAEAQYAPIYAISFLDYDRDGNTDVLLCGNNSHAKLRLGKLDSSYGTLLQGDGAGTFRYIPQTRSGLNLKGDIRAITTIGDQWFFGINEQKIASYKLQEKL